MSLHAQLAELQRLTQFFRESVECEQMLEEVELPSVEAAFIAIQAKIVAIALAHGWDLIEEEEEEEEEELMTPWVEDEEEEEEVEVPKKKKK